MQAWRAIDLINTKHWLQQSSPPPLLLQEALTSDDGEAMSDGEVPTHSCTRALTCARAPPAASTSTTRLPQHMSLLSLPMHTCPSDEVVMNQLTLNSDESCDWEEAPQDNTVREQFDGHSDNGTDSHRHAFHVAIGFPPRRFPQAWAHTRCSDPKRARLTPSTSVTSSLPLSTCQCTFPTTDSLEVHACFVNLL